MQLVKLRSIETELINNGYQIIAISPDRPEKIVEKLDMYKYNYLLLSDSKLSAAKAFGIAFKVDETTIKKYNEFGIDLKEASGFDHNLLPVPSVFILDKNGIIKFKYVNSNYKVRLNPEEIIKVVKDLKIADK